MANQGKKSRKAAERQERRRKAQRQQMIRNMIVLTGVALLFAAIVIYMANRPVGEIVEVEPKDRPIAVGKTLGDPEAPVVMEVFEDFQCPACRLFTEEVEPQVVEEYVTSGSVYLIYRHYAFIGPESRNAAKASMCAAEQERFWDYHDIIFANQTGENIGAFSDRRLEAFAETIGLDVAEFNTCFGEKRYENEINEDFVLGQGLSITGTPSIAINGQLLPDFQYFTVQQAIEAQLNQ